MEHIDGPIIINSVSSENAKWYVVHTYSGHEKKVALTLRQRAEASGHTKDIFKVFIPQQQKIVVSEGKKRSVEERLFPGYVLVNMDMNDGAWHIVRSTPGVTGFVGMGNKPTSVSDAEVETLMKYSKVETPKFESKFTVGDSVRINEGPFKDFMGQVNNVNNDQGKAEILVSVFGRETPVELDFTQITRI